MKNNFNRNISLNLKAFRQKNGWSLDETSRRTRVSKAMLGQIERGESSPTIATLWKIAKGFHLSFSAFLEDFNEKKEQLDTLNTEKIHTFNSKKIEVTTLFPFDKQIKSEIFLLKLFPGYEHLSEPHEPGVIEQIIVLEGEVEILIEKKWKSVKKDKGIKFNAAKPHGYRNRKKMITSFYNIIYYTES